MEGNISVADPEAYPTCAMGMILPLVDESNMSMSLRIVMYLVGKCLIPGIIEEYKKLAE